MAKNVIFYGSPGTGKTYFLQEMMSDYIDYQVSDRQIISAYTKNTQDWILLSLIFIQNHGKMTLSQLQKKTDSLHLGKRINVGSVIEVHDINGTLPDMMRRSPSIFFKCDDYTWYVSKIKIQQFMPDFFSVFLSDSEVEQRYAFVTFHQSFSYEDFVEGIRPEYISETNSIDYSPKPGIFKQICLTAASHPEKEYAVFIDEINRGNLSEIFGELISLIELDKRKHAVNELTVTLPYSKDSFSVPSNLNIFGTMNSADRSIGSIDIALRRRFDFIPFQPSSKIIRKELTMHHIDPENIDGINLVKMFEMINDRIELLLDQNHLLGHALFLSVRSGTDLVKVMQDKVIPLLEEYFFNDLQKIQMIFNDLTPSGDLKQNAVYQHKELSVDSCFDYTGDFLLLDKNRYFVNPELSPECLIHIYG